MAESQGPSRPATEPNLRSLLSKRSRAELEALPLGGGQALGMPGRTQGRHVELGPGWEGLSHSPGVVSELLPEHDFLPEVVPLEYQGTGLAERVCCYCVAESFDRYRLQDEILRRAGSLQAFPEVLVSTYARAGSGRSGEVFFFDFGCVVAWALDVAAERYILKEVVAPCMEGALPEALVEKDRLSVRYTSAPKHVIENDSLALHYTLADDLRTKLALAFALAQSTKLSVHEERLRRLGASLAPLPASLAERGEVPVSERAIMRHIGRLFLQQSAVNLLGRVLDTPDVIYDFPDNVRSLYKSAVDYLEVEVRCGVVNDRFSVIHEMLDILRVHAQKSYFATLEAAVMWLVGVCAVVAVVQLVGLLGWHPHWAPRP